MQSASRTRLFKHASKYSTLVSSTCWLQRCDKEGARVIATDMNFEKLKELQQERPSIEIDHLDVTKKEKVEHLLNLRLMMVCILGKRESKTSRTKRAEERAK